MSDSLPSVASVRSMPTAAAAPAWMRPALVALLVGELLYLTVSFDTEALGKAGSVWTLLAGWSSQYVRIAIAAVGALALLAVTGFASPRWTRRADDTRVSGGWLLLHLAAFAAFIWLTRRFFTAGATVATHPGTWTITWLLAGVAMMASWAVATFPARRWWMTAVENRAVMALSVATGTAIWAASFITESLWTPLARVTFNVVTTILGFVYADTVSRPDRLIVGTSKFRVLISPECSGYEGIGLILAFLTIYLLVFRKELRFPAAFLLLPVGAVAMWLVNIGRIVALIAIGTSGWPAVARGGFHSQAGWLAFNGVALAFVALTNQGGYFRRARNRATEAAIPRRPTTSATADSTIASLGPFVALLAASMLTGAFSAGFDWLYPVRIVAAMAVLWRCRASYRQLTWSCSWHAPAIGLLTAAMWILTFPLTSLRESSWPAALLAANGVGVAAWLALKTFGYVLVVPIVEELAFRVYAMRRLIDEDISAVPVGSFSLVSLAVSSLIFGALHGALWIQGALAGVAFACALYRRRSVGDAVLAHATTNALIAVYVFTTGQWSVWS